MARDMANTYRNRKTEDLRRLRSQKYNRLTTLEATRGWSYLAMQEIRTLKFHIDRIDAELEARRLQTSYME